MAVLLADSDFALGNYFVATSREYQHLDLKLKFKLSYALALLPPERP